MGNQFKNRNQAKIKAHQEQHGSTDKKTVQLNRQQGTDNRKAATTKSKAQNKQAKQTATNKRTKAAAKRAGSPPEANGVGKGGKRPSQTKAAKVQQTKVNKNKNSKKKTTQ